MAGFVGVPPEHGGLHGFLTPVFAPAKSVLAELPGAAADHGEGGIGLMVVSGLVAIVGILGAWYGYVRRPTIPAAVALGFPQAHRLLYNKYFVDEIYDACIVAPLRRFGRFCFAVDRWFIDSVLKAVSLVPQAMGLLLRGFQHGSMQGYATGMTVGVIAIVIWLLIRMAGGAGIETAALTGG